MSSAFRKSYERIFDLLRGDLKELNIVYEVSGFTLDMMAKLTPDVLGKLRRAVESGQCEFMGSPYAHSIMTNFAYKDGVQACKFAMDTYQRHLGMRPRTDVENPECCWNEDIRKFIKRRVLI